jgi:Recombination endonuclease VII
MRDPCLKLCPHCGEIKSKDHRYYHASIGKLSHRKHHLEHTYGITLEEYTAKIQEQGNVCAICKTKYPTDVDHNHITGKTRGILCGDCNVALGIFKENTTYLQEAIRYLLKDSLF